MKLSDPLILALAGALGILVHSGTPAVAQQLLNPCPYANDGDCDEPNGLNLCAWGTDTTDCSNPNSNYGYGTGYGGGASTDSAGRHLNCPYTNDGDCDEPNGLNLCAWGTDSADCSNPNANYGSGYQPGSSVAHGGATAAPAPAPAPGGAITTFSPWTRITNDPRQYAAQPGGMMPLVVYNGANFAAGDYVIYYGVTTGAFGPVTNVQMQPVTLASNTRYAARATSMGFESFQPGGSALMMHSDPGPGRAMIYARNDDMQNWRAICVLPVGIPISQCGA